MSVASYIFDSNATLAVATVVTGYVAWLIYRKQKTDSKRDAASIILLKIKNAERQLKLAKDSLQRDGNLLERISVMPSESWSRYKYLFVKDLDRDDWDTVNEFFTRCQAYDQAVGQNYSAFGRNEEQIRVVAHHLAESAANKLLSTVTADPSKEASAVKDYTAYLELLNDLYLVKLPKPMYTPKKYKTDAEFLLDALSTDISQKSPGQVLKRLAHDND